MSAYSGGQIKYEDSDTIQFAMLGNLFSILLEFYVFPKFLTCFKQFWRTKFLKVTDNQRHEMPNPNGPSKYYSENKFFFKLLAVSNLQ